MKWLWLVLILVVCSLRAQMPIILPPTPVVSGGGGASPTFVQAVGTNDDVTRTALVTAPITTSSGDYLVAGACWDAGGGSVTATVSDGKNTWSAWTSGRLEDTVNGQYYELFTAPVTTAGSTTFTITFNSSVSYGETFIVCEFHGTLSSGTVDQVGNNAPGTGTSPASLATFTTGNNYQMVVGYAFDDTGNSSTLNAGGSFTKAYTVSPSGSPAVMIYEQMPTAGAVTPQITWTGTMRVAGGALSLKSQ
jgi:hypothetical protein